MAEKGKMLKGALAREPKRTRLSPGVYRDEKGGLVSAKGRAIKRPTQGDYQTTPPPGVAPMPSSMQSAMDLGNQIAAQKTMQGAPAGIETLPYKMIPAEYRDAMRTLQVPQQPTNAMYVAPEAMPLMTNRGPQPWSNMQPQPAIRIEQGNIEQLLGQSANNQGRYRLSPGVYGTREQAMQQMQRQYGAPVMGVPQQPQRRY